MAAPTPNPEIWAELRAEGLGQAGTFFFLFKVELLVYGSSQAKGQIGATVAGLHHGHSNVGSELCLQPMPQLAATPDP